MLNKIFAITGAVAGITAGGIGIAYLTYSPSKEQKNDKQNVVSEKTIKDWLNEAGKVMLEEQDAEWSERWTKFKENLSAEKGHEDPWKLNDWKNVFAQSDAPPSFKFKCKKNAEQKISNGSGGLFEKVKEYCTKNKPAT